MSTTAKQTAPRKAATRSKNTTDNKSVSDDEQLKAFETGSNPLLVKPGHPVFHVAQDLITGHNVCLTGPTGNGKSSITRATLRPENYPDVLAGSLYRQMDPPEINVCQIDLSLIAAPDEIYSKEKIKDVCSETVPVLIGKFCQEFGESRSAFEKLQKENEKARLTGKGRVRLFVISLDDIGRVLMPHVMNAIIPLGDGCPAQYLQAFETTRYISLQLVASTNCSLSPEGGYTAAKEQMDLAHHNRFHSHYYIGKADVEDILKKEFPPNHHKAVEALCRVHAAFYRARKNDELESLGEITLRQLRSKMLDICQAGNSLRTAMEKMLLWPLDPECADYMNAERILSRHCDGGKEASSRIHESFNDLFEL